MPRFNEFSGKSAEQRARNTEAQKARRMSLESRGADVAGLMADLGIGERRACAEAERRFGLIWNDGRSFGLEQGHTQATVKD